ncbi:hypothetical protein LXA43DRAFT_976252 [Ganoderma leucocontextum]|nr:hypothetical protein LXA43DRAFT_976252 [Ganoderma leucocontextum]
MKDVQHVPYDIWHLIFQYTCTDGGLSGCALARTSKTFQALSASTRFYSLTLSSVTEVKNFLLCLERIRRAERAPSPSSESPSTIRTSANAESSSATGPPPIHHLLLAFLPDTCDAPQRTFRRWTDYARDERSLVFQLANDHKAWAAHKAHWNREYVLHVSRLLRLAAPTLRSLAVLQCPEVRLPLVHYHRFPFLCELTLLADDRLFVRAPGGGALIVGQNDPSDFDLYGVPAEPPEDAPFPALTHLHVVCAGPKLHPWEKTLPLWAAIAPAVTHLRISQARARTPAVLAEMLGVPPLPTPPEDGELEGVDSEEPLAPGPEPEPSYRSLDTVIVQMSSARKTNGAEDPSLRELQHIVDVCEAEGGHAPRVAILRSRTYVPGYWESRLRWEWQSRMVRGGGCWTEDEEHENVWKDFHGVEQPKRSKLKKGRINKVSIREAQDGSLETGTAEAERPGKKWWKVLANGMPRLNGRRSMSPPFASSQSMDRIPVDIWDHIFAYACSDGGRTGAALASTSYFLSSVSAPYRFHSLKLTSLSQIGKLLLCHERMIRGSSTMGPRPGKHAHSSATLGARHLLLAFLPGECDAPARPWRGWSEYSRRKHKREDEIVEDEQAWESSKAAWDRQFEYLVPRLFQLVGPTLETLAVLQHADVALPYAGGHFPRLRELSLLADDRLFVRPEPHWTTVARTSDREELERFWSDVTRVPPFPALTHLHVVYEGPKQVPWEKTLPLWAKLAPEVTHIRVSQASKLMPEVLDGIASKSFAQAQGTAGLRGSPPGSRKRVSFLKLRRAIVQPLVLEPRCVGGGIGTGTGETDSDGSGRVGCSEGRDAGLNEKKTKANGPTSAERGRS